jgi:hypothetical protein
VNVYTRREEMRWTLVALVVLVLTTGGSVARLMTAKGPLIPDPAALASAKNAEARATQAKTCAQAADKLNTEIPVFKASAKAARLATPAPSATAPLPRGRKPPPPKEKEPDIELAWPTAMPAWKQAKALAPCRASLEGVVPANPDATKAWDAIATAAAINPTAATPGDEHKVQVEAARNLLAALENAPIDKLIETTKAAETNLKKASEAEAEKAKSATVREGLPPGLLPRQLAVGIGVLIGVITLLASFLSVRATASRRLSTLVPLREAAKQGQPGLQAAAVLTLAAQHNGGEPGLVLGAGLGGLAAAIAFPIDADIFVAGVMVGLLLGLGIQWSLRLSQGMGAWRRRATELADIEKPATPIVLVLSAVHVGREAEFWGFFSNLSPPEQANTVLQLASQAEEQILAAAEATNSMPPGGMPQPQGASMPPQGMPGGAPGYPQQPGQYPQQPGQYPQQGGYPPPGGGYPPQGGGGMPPSY